jgi:hypothetical protein
MADGWIGLTRQFDHAVRTFGAEVDAEDRVLVAGKLPVSFMGAGDELVVDEETLVRVGGKWVSALNLVSATSYGSKVKVF